MKNRITCSLVRGFAVEDGWIYDSLGNEVPDGEIRFLLLPYKINRTLLEATKFLTSGDHSPLLISDLLFHDMKSMLLVPGLGPKSVRAIIRSFLKYFNDCLVNKASQTYPFTYGSKKYESGNNETTGFSSDSIMALFRNNEFGAFTEEQLADSFPGVDRNLVSAAAKQLLDAGRVEIKGKNIYKVHDSFLDYSIRYAEAKGSSLTKRHLDILILRCQGKTFGEISKIMNRAPERIRQIERDAFRILLYSHNEPFAEDRWALLFQKYKLEKTLFMEALQQEYKAWLYLNIRYKAGTLSTEGLLLDPLLDDETRTGIDKYYHRKEICIGDGQYIPKKKFAILDYLLERYCQEEISLDDFLKLYNGFIAEKNLVDCETLLPSGTSADSWAGHFIDSAKVLLKRNRILRFYDIGKYDYTHLRNALNLSQYQNIEISTLKLFRENPSVMEEYDIRDEYELHNLLKKIHAEKWNPSLKFGRMPIISFGEFDNQKVVSQVVQEYAPASIKELCDILSQKYGVNEWIVRGRWLKGISGLKLK